MERSYWRELITVLISFIAIFTVFAAAGGYLPAGRLPQVSSRVIDAIPHINVLISVLAIATIGIGWSAIRSGRLTRHRKAMGIAVGLFGLFLILYLYRLTILGGPAGFNGPVRVYQYVYLPILAIHIGLAVLCVPLVFDALALAMTEPTEELPHTRHPVVGRLAASLWIVSYALGIVVYLLLYWL